MITITEVSKKTGISVRSLRHYTSIGLIESLEEKSMRKIRNYAEEEVEKILLINLLRKLGLNLNEIGCILGCNLISIVDFKVDEKTPSRDVLIEKLIQRKIELDLVFNYLDIK